MPRCDEHNLEFSTETELNFHNLLYHVKAPVIIKDEHVYPPKCVVDTYSGDPRALCKIGKGLHLNLVKLLWDGTNTQWEAAMKAYERHIEECSQT